VRRAVGCERERKIFRDAAPMYVCVCVCSDLDQRVLGPASDLFLFGEISKLIHFSLAVSV